MDETVIRVENLYKTYRKGKINAKTFSEDVRNALNRILKSEKRELASTINALSDVSFKVKKGEVVGIIGANGAGKSTLLKIISRVTTPTMGRILIRGRVSGMLEIGTGFHSELTGRENIYLSGRILGMSRSEIDKKIDEIIEFSECSEFIDTPVKRYSSGMYVRLAFAVAAHLEADIMILDEVLAVGDTFFKQKCLEKIHSLASEGKRTILFVSHSMASVRSVCSRVIVLKNGKVDFDGDTESGIEHYYSEYPDRKTHINYSDMPELKKVFVPEMTSIEECRFDGESSYITDNVLRLRIRVKNLSSYEHGGVRVTVIDSAGNPAASYVKRDLYTAVCGKEGQILSEVDISGLIDGKYSFVVSVFKTEGNTIEFERAQGMKFKKEDIARKDAEKWRAAAMGSVMLNGKSSVSF